MSIKERILNFKKEREEKRELVKKRREFGRTYQINCKANNVHKRANLFKLLSLYLFPRKEKIECVLSVDDETFKKIEKAADKKNESILKEIFKEVPFLKLPFRKVIELVVKKVFSETAIRCNIIKAIREDKLYLVPIFAYCLPHEEVITLSKKYEYIEFLDKFTVVTEIVCDITENPSYKFIIM